MLSDNFIISVTVMLSERSKIISSIFSFAMKELEISPEIEVCEGSMFSSNL